MSDRPTPRTDTLFEGPWGQKWSGLREAVEEIERENAELREALSQQLAMTDEVEFPCLPCSGCQKVLPLLPKGRCVECENARARALVGKEET